MPTSNHITPALPFFSHTLVFLTQNLLSALLALQCKKLSRLSTRVFVSWRLMKLILELIELSRRDWETDLKRDSETSGYAGMLVSTRRFVFGIPGSKKTRVSSSSTPSRTFPPSFWCIGSSHALLRWRWGKPIFSRWKTLFWIPFGIT